MKKNQLFTVSLFLCSIGISAQVGVNTATPKATLDVTKKNDLSIPDGVLLPRFTGDELKARDNAYGEDQNGTMVFVTQPITYDASYNGKVSEVGNTGLYYYDHTKQKWATTGAVNSKMNVKKLTNLNAPTNYTVQPEDDVILVTGDGSNGVIRILLPWSSNNFPIGKTIYISVTTNEDSPINVGVLKAEDPNFSTPGTRDYSVASTVYSGYTQAFMYIGDKDTPDPNPDPQQPNKKLSPWINITGV